MSAPTPPRPPGPPPVIAAQPKPAWRREIGPLLRPALTYHLWVVVMLAVFSITILVFEGVKSENFLILGVLGVSTIFGVIAGQALAIWRARACSVGCLGGLYTGFCMILSPALVAMGPIGGVVLAVLILFPVAVSGGLWSLASNRALPAAWLPVVYGIGAIIVIIEEKGKLSTWQAGNKTGIWDVGTALILLLVVGLLVLYLVQRERHRLHRWRFAPRSLLEGTVTERGSARPRLTAFGWLLMVLLSLALTGGTLLIAPYLFRTGRTDEGNHHGDGQQQQQQQQQQQNQHQGDGFGEMMERAREAAENAFKILCPFLIALLLASLVVAGAWRPARRALYVRYLRSPPWPISPTKRIENAWRLIEIALEDVGLERTPSEDARAFYARNEAAIKTFNPDLAPKVQEGAELRDRVAFGLGVSAGDVDKFVEVAEWIFLDVSDRIAAGKQAQAYWRKV